MRVSIVGAGRVGTALAVLLSAASGPDAFEVVAVSGGEETASRSRRHLGMPPVPVEEAARLGELVLICTPDDAIASVCGSLADSGAFRSRQWVGHVSGSTGLGALAAAELAGAGVLSLHPLQTFPSVEAALARIPASAMAVTARSEDGFALGERVARAIGARPFRLLDGSKALYHAAAVFASNHLVAVTALADALFRQAGLPQPSEQYLPLQLATIENVASMGPGAALTGPAVRGDADTIAHHLEVLNASAPETVPAYVTLTRVCLDLAVRSGRLDEEGRARVERALAPWT
jgi:predicted short-subunit dehydrogenase-like oxidoreductase (DUF2520 family)